MRIAVIGTIVRDEIHHYDGRISRSPGGLLHTIQALRAVAAPGDEILPFCYAGNDIRATVQTLLGDAPNVDLAGIRFLERPNNYVRIEYFSPQERREYSLRPLPALPFTLLRGALACDAILINMISGWDIQLSVLQKIRAAFKGLLALDMHSLLLGRASDGQRFFREPPEVKHWLKTPDILQMNEWEFKVISKGQTAEKFFLQDSCFKDGKILNLTFGIRGSRTLQKAANRPTVIKVAPPATITVVDPTGCGDAFMAGFCYTYLTSGQTLQAAQKANLLAAISGSFKGLATAQQLRAKLKEFHG